MKILIIEDEHIAAQKLNKMLLEIDPAIEVLRITGSIKESVNWLVHHTADLIFLDIQLSDGLSFSIFEEVNVNTPIIFTTAYNQYAIKAFELNSIAYLLKPIRKTDLIDSLRKFEHLKAAFTIDFDELLATIQGHNPDYKKRFLIQIGEKIKKIEVSEIAYFHAWEQGIYITTFDNKSLPIDQSLNQLMEVLNPEKFFRINRKFIVNMDAIANMISYSRNRVKLELKPAVEDEYDTIVSIERSAEFKEWLNS